MTEQVGHPVGHNLTTRVVALGFARIKSTLSLQDWLIQIESFPEEDARVEIDRLQAEINERMAQLQALAALLAARNAVVHDAGVNTFTVTQSGVATVGAPIGYWPGLQVPLRGASEGVDAPSKLGTSAAIIAVMESDPRRQWSAKELLLALAQRRQLPGSSDPRRAVDATLHRLAEKTHQIERVARGRYRIVSAEPPREQLGLEPEDEDEVG